MKKEEFAKKKVVSAGLDRLLTGSNGREVDVLCIPDSDGLEVHNNGHTHVCGCNRTAIVLTCRNDGSATSILAALDLMIASLATAQ